jgi:hypothetical protein
MELDNKELQAFVDSLERGERPDRMVVSRWLTKEHNPMSLNDWSAIQEAMMKSYELTETQFKMMLREPLFVQDDEFKDDFMEIINKYEIGGWLRKYINYTMGVEPPTAYHFAVGFTVLGASLHRQVWFDQKFYKIFPAVQTFLVGPSGKTRKSTAANIGMALAEEAGRIHRLPDQSTPEALLKELGELSRDGSASALLYSSELSTFLNRKEYNQDLVQVLTDLFDCRDIVRRRTVGGGNLEIRNIAVSAILCSNETWLASSVHESAFGGGFLGRTLVWHALGTDRYFPFPELPDENVYKQLVGELGLTRYYGAGDDGRVNVTPAGEKWYKDKYLFIKKHWPDDERLVPFWERYPDHLLRMAMVLNVSETLATGVRDVTISDVELIQADAVLTWIYGYLPRVYANLGNTGFGDEARRVYQYIKRNGGQVASGQLGRAMAKRMSSGEVRRIIGTLVQNKVLETMTGTEWDGGYSVKIVTPWED